jgi:mono/diheme cytochrome c family protein
MAKKNGLLNALLFSGAAIVGMFLLSSPAKSQGAGEQVYKTKCASCHGADGAGATPVGKATKARDFCSDEVKKETDEEWTTIIVKGKNKMPAYDKKLTDAEIKDVVAYIRGLCKK